MRAVLVGGVGHGTTIDVHDYRPPPVLNMQRRIDTDLFTFTSNPDVEPAPPIDTYELRHYTGSPPPSSWVSTPPRGWPYYFCRTTPEQIRLNGRIDDDDMYYAQVAEQLWYTYAETLIPTRPKEGH